MLTPLTFTASDRSKSTPASSATSPKRKPTSPASETPESDEVDYFSFSSKVSEPPEGAIRDIPDESGIVTPKAPNRSRANSEATIKASQPSPGKRKREIGDNGDDLKKLELKERKSTSYTSFLPLSDSFIDRCEVEAHQRETERKEELAALIERTKPTIPLQSPTLGPRPTIENVKAEISTPSRASTKSPEPTLVERSLSWGTKTVEALSGTILGHKQTESEVSPKNP